MNDFPLGASPSLRAVLGCSITIILANHVFLNKEGGGGGGGEVHPPATTPP